MLADVCVSFEIPWATTVRAAVINGVRYSNIRPLLIQVGWWVMLLAGLV